MSWLPLIAFPQAPHLSVGQLAPTDRMPGSTGQYCEVSGAGRPANGAFRSGGVLDRDTLGSATAAQGWTWAEAPLAAISGIPVASPFAADDEMRQRITSAAVAFGRTEAEIWAEAARERLARHHYDDEPPPTAPAAAPARSPRSAHTWAASDDLLAALCAPASVPSGAPAA